MASLDEYLGESLNTIKRANWYRQEQLISSMPSAVVEIEGRKLVNFASNDYLGLASDKRLITAVKNAVEQYGTGSTGSRLLSGHRSLHDTLEKSIALWKKSQDALVFSSGYTANLGTITALVNKKDLILADEYNHSSLKNGAKLSQANVINYQHCNTQDIVKKLTTNRDNYRHCLIVTDSVFSMDGDLCPLPELIAIAHKFDCWLLIDDAHATGVIGKTGAGSLEHFEIQSTDNIIQIGTLSKAVGSLGGYVSGSTILINFLRNRCPTWIYTTALSPADTAAAIAGIEVIRSEPDCQKRLWHNINTLKQRLKQLNLDFFESDSAIICLKSKTATSALELSSKLRSEGFWIPAIRPPTVPTSRLRFSVMTTHQTEQIDRLHKILT